MSTLTYAGVPLGHLRMLDYRADVLTEGEGKTYLGTRYTLSVRGTYNPQTVAYTQTPFDPPVAVVGTMAPTTEVALRHVLSQPRQLLVYSIGGQEVLRSPSYVHAPDPGPSYGCDIENGPWPIVRRIDTRHGAVKSFVVDFSVTTTLNECNRFVETPSALLSHRWTETHTLDQDFFETRLIQGRAVFRADRLLEIGARADDYRAWLFHPVATNFKRDRIEVRQSDDGRLLEYQLTDRARPLNINPSGNARNVTRIEAYEVAASRSPGFEDQVLAGIGIVAGGLDNLGNLVALARQTLPSSSRTVVVRVWGNKNSDRQQLELCALDILEARQAIANGSFGAAAATFENQITYDLAGKFVEARVREIRGPFNTTFRNFWTIPPAPVNDSSGNVLVTAPDANLLPPGDGGSRGTYLAHAIAAALQAPCQVPAPPPNTDRIVLPSRRPP